MGSSQSADMSYTQKVNALAALLNQLENIEISEIFGQISQLNLNSENEVQMFVFRTVEKAIEAQNVSAKCAQLLKQFYQTILPENQKKFQEFLQQRTKGSLGILFDLKFSHLTPDMVDRIQNTSILIGHFYNVGLFDTMTIISFIRKCNLLENNHGSSRMVLATIKDTIQGQSVDDVCKNDVGITALHDMLLASGFVDQLQGGRGKISSVDVNQVEPTTKSSENDQNSSQNLSTLTPDFTFPTPRVRNPLHTITSIETSTNSSGTLTKTSTSISIRQIPPNSGEKSYDNQGVFVDSAILAFKNSPESPLVLANEQNIPNFAEFDKNSQLLSPNKDETVKVINIEDKSVTIYTAPNQKLEDNQKIMTETKLPSKPIAVENIIAFEGKYTSSGSKSPAKVDNSLKTSQTMVANDFTNFPTLSNESENATASTPVHPFMNSLIVQTQNTDLSIITTEQTLSTAITTHNTLSKSSVESNTTKSMAETLRTAQNQSNLVKDFSEYLNLLRTPSSKTFTLTKFNGTREVDRKECVKILFQFGIDNPAHHEKLVKFIQLLFTFNMRSSKNQIVKDVPVFFTELCDQKIKTLAKNDKNWSQTENFGLLLAHMYVMNLVKVRIMYAWLEEVKKCATESDIPLKMLIQVFKFVGASMKKNDRNRYLAYLKEFEEMRQKLPKIYENLFDNIWTMSGDSASTVHTHNRQPFIQNLMQNPQTSTPKLPQNLVVKNLIVRNSNLVRCQSISSNIQGHKNTLVTSSMSDLSKSANLNKIPPKTNYNNQSSSLLVREFESFLKATHEHSSNVENFNLETFKKCRDAERRQCAVLMLNYAIDNFQSADKYADIAHRILQTSAKTSGTDKTFIMHLTDVCDEKMKIFTNQHPNWREIEGFGIFLGHMYVFEVQKLYLMNTWMNEVKACAIENDLALKMFFKVFKIVHRKMFNKDIKSYTTNKNEVLNYKRNHPNRIPTMFEDWINEILGIKVANKTVPNTSQNPVAAVRNQLLSRSQSNSSSIQSKLQCSSVTSSISDISAACVGQNESTGAIKKVLSPSLTTSICTKLQEFLNIFDAKNSAVFDPELFNDAPENALKGCALILIEHALLKKDKIHTYAFITKSIIVPNMRDADQQEKFKKYLSEYVIIEMGKHLKVDKPASSNWDRVSKINTYVCEFFNHDLIEMSTVEIWLERLQSMADGGCEGLMEVKKDLEGCKVSLTIEKFRQYLNLIQEKKQAEYPAKLLNEAIKNVLMECATIFADHTILNSEKCGIYVNILKNIMLPAFSNGTKRNTFKYSLRNHIQSEIDKCLNEESPNWTQVAKINDFVCELFIEDVVNVEYIKSWIDRLQVFVNDDIDEAIKEFNIALVKVGDKIAANLKIFEKIDEKNCDESKIEEFNSSAIIINEKSQSDQKSDDKKMEEYFKNLILINKADEVLPQKPSTSTSNKTSSKTDTIENKNEQKIDETNQNTNKTQPEKTSKKMVSKSVQTIKEKEELSQPKKIITEEMKHAKELTNEFRQFDFVLNNPTKYNYQEMIALIMTLDMNSPKKQQNFMKFFFNFIIKVSDFHDSYVRIALMISKSKAALFDFRSNFMSFLIKEFMAKAADFHTKTPEEMKTLENLTIFIGEFYNVTWISCIDIINIFKQLCHNGFKNDSQITLFHKLLNVTSLRLIATGEGVKIRELFDIVAVTVAENRGAVNFFKKHTILSTIQCIWNNAKVIRSNFTDFKAILEHLNENNVKESSEKFRKMKINDITEYSDSFFEVYLANETNAENFAKFINEIEDVFVIDINGIRNNLKILVIGRIQTTVGTGAVIKEDILKFTMLICAFYKHDDKLINDIIFFVNQIVKFPMSQSIESVEFLIATIGKKLDSVDDRHLNLIIVTLMQKAKSGSEKMKIEKLIQMRKNEIEKSSNLTPKTPKTVNNNEKDITINDFIKKLPEIAENSQQLTVMKAMIFKDKSSIQNFVAAALYCCMEDSQLIDSVMKFCKSLSGHENFKESLSSSMNFMSFVNHYNSSAAVIFVINLYKNQLIGITSLRAWLLPQRIEVFNYNEISELNELMNDLNCDELKKEVSYLDNLMHEKFMDMCSNIQIDLTNVDGIVFEDELGLD